MNIPVNGKKVLIRVDFNVPLFKNKTVTDDTRIRGASATIKYVLDNGGSAILMSHLGRPMKKLKEDGSIDVEKFSLRNIVYKVEEVLGMGSIQFCPETVGAKAREMVAALQPGQVLLLENTRFNEGETKGDVELARGMADLGADVYINDAFGTAHREHASTATVARYFDKDKRAFGFLMEREIKYATKLLNEADRPFTAIVGGAKVSDKIGLIQTLIHKADNLIIGGGMAYTFVKAQGGKIGKSLCENDKLELALELLDVAKKNNTQIYLPKDTMTADAFSNEANREVFLTHQIPDHLEGLDIGPETIEQFQEVILASKTLLWNGPMGVFEFDNFSVGTFAIAKSVAEATQKGAFSLIGGGDSVAAINKSGLAEEVSFVSTGGGAMLEFLEGKQLPGIKAILE